MVGIAIPNPLLVRELLYGEYEYAGTLAGL